MNENIQVSICCLTFNHQRYIKKTIEGFLSQKANFAFEILIHDDASTDMTRQIIEEFQQKYPYIVKPIFQEENQWSRGNRALSMTYNFPRAEGKYIAMCEGDDYWIDPFKLQKQFDYLERHPDCSLVFTGCEIDKGRERKLISYPSLLTLNATEYVSSSYFIATASMMFRKNVLQTPKEEWMDKAFAGDFILKYRLLLVGKFGYINAITCVYNKGVVGSWSKRKLNKDLIIKEFSDNLRGLYYLAKNVELSGSILKNKIKQLRQFAYYKIALSKGNFKGLVFLVLNINRVSLQYFLAFMKGLVTR